MNAMRAADHNRAYPYTVAPCDNERSFEMRSFTTLELAGDYAAQTGGRPYVIVVASGAVLATHNFPVAKR